MNDNTKVCKIKGCNNKIYARNYCSKHYREFVRKTKCKVDGCESYVDSRGYCVKHYNRWKTHKDPLKVISRKIVGKCKVESCKSDIYCRGYCVRHYQRFMKYGDPLKSQVNVEHDGKCVIDGCEGIYYAKNMCEEHYRREYRSRYKRSERGRETSRMNCQKRRARKKKVPINDFTTKQWKECLSYFGNKCAYCGSEEGTLNQEHNIPISRGGSHTKTNVIPSCGTCNSSKGTRTMHEWYSTYEHYDKKREEKILRYLGYKFKENQIQLQLF